MYELEIKTIYNDIKIVVEDLESEDVKEILSQPYVLEVKTKVCTEEKSKRKVLKGYGTSN